MSHDDASLRVIIRCVHAFQKMFNTTRMQLKQYQWLKDPILKVTDKKYQTTYSH